MKGFRDLEFETKDGMETHTVQLFGVRVERARLPADTRVRIKDLVRDGNGSIWVIYSARRMYANLLCVTLLRVQDGESLCPPIPTSVLVSPSVVQLAPDQEIELTAIVLDEDGAPIPGAYVTWQSSDPSVVELL
jgi:hypothetical protein